MMRYKRIKFLVGVCVISFLAFLIASRFIYFGRVGEYIPSQKISDYEMILNGQAVVVNWEKKENKLFLDKDYKESMPRIEVGNRYIISQELLLNQFFFYKEYAPYYRNTYNFGEYVKLVVYDSQNEMATKEIDMFRVIRNYNKNYISNLDYAIVFDEQNEEYVEFEVWDTTNIADDEKPPMTKIYVHLTTEKVYSENDLSIVPSNLIWDGGYISDSLIGNLKSENIGIDSTNWIFLADEFTKDNASDWSFKERYPDAYQLFLEDNPLYLLKSDTDFPLQAKALSLFFPEGYNLFENATIPAYASIDGQSHSVNSYEEFIKYYHPNIIKED